MTLFGIFVPLETKSFWMYESFILINTQYNRHLIYLISK
jgi:hypothetical protein